MDAVIKSVEKVIIEKLKNTEHIAIVFDGWTERSNHYLAVFAAIPEDTPLLLAFAPFINKEHLTADEHIKFMDFVIDLFQVQASKIKCIVADNTSTNKAFAIKICVPFIGCASHRLSLAVNKYYLEVNKLVLDKVHIMMVKLGTIKRKGIFTYLRSITSQCWLQIGPVKWFKIRSMVRSIPNGATLFQVAKVFGTF